MIFPINLSRYENYPRYFFSCSCIVCCSKACLPATLPHLPIIPNFPKETFNYLFLEPNYGNPWTHPFFCTLCTQGYVLRWWWKSKICAKHTTFIVFVSQIFLSLMLDGLCKSICEWLEYNRYRMLGKITWKSCKKDYIFPCLVATPHKNNPSPSGKIHIWRWNMKWEKNNKENLWKIKLKFYNKIWRRETRTRPHPIWSFHSALLRSSYASLCSHPAKSRIKQIKLLLYSIIKFEFIEIE